MRRFVEQIKSEHRKEVSVISNIRGERSRRDMTQEQLADCLKVAPSTIRSWEDGTTKPGPHLLVAMSDLFGCSIDYLLGRTDERLGIYRQQTQSN